MNNHFLMALFVLLCASLACNSSTDATPTPPIHTSPTIPIQSSPTSTQLPTPTTATESMEDSEPSPQDLLDQVRERSRGVLVDVTYCSMDAVELKMDIYLPKNQTGRSPLVIYIHGGGWRSGDKRSLQGIIDVPSLLDEEFTIAFINYRLAPEYLFPAMLEDVKCAVRHFRGNAGKYRINPDRIGVWGWSAGAHLSSMIGLTDASAGFDVGEYSNQSSRVQAVVTLASPADMTMDLTPSFIEARDTAFINYDLAKASPIAYGSPDDPPFLILQGDGDPVVTADQGDILYESLISAGVEAKLVVVENGDHSFRKPGQSPTRSELTTVIVDFFVQHLK